MLNPKSTKENEANLISKTATAVIISTSQKVSLPGFKEELHGSQYHYSIGRKEISNIESALRTLHQSELDIFVEDSGIYKFAVNKGIV
jgi:hypothetical protein